MSVIISGDNGISDVDGSAGTPAIRGTDANTGIFFGSDIIGFSEGGTECARFNADAQFVAAAGTASLPVLTTTGDLNTGIFFPAADTIAFAEGGAEAMRINSSGNVGIGTSSVSTDYFSDRILQLTGPNSAAIKFERTSATVRKWEVGLTTGGNFDFVDTVGDATTPRARITSGGELCVGQTVSGIANTGSSLLPSGRARFCISGSEVLEINRLVSDGILVLFYQDTVTEGNISVSGSTVSYNGGHLSRYAQTTTAKDESLKKGTVLSNLDEMNVYIAPTTYWTEEDELPEGVNVGDVKVETHEVQNEQLNKVKVSDVEGDANVAGVFVNWYYDEAHQVDEINMAMTGDMIIRIAQGVTVARGDLLMSAGDGTAMPQGDDIVRSKTIAKVTSTHVTCTYDDGSYCVPCVLMAC